MKESMAALLSKSLSKVRVAFLLTYYVQLDAPFVLQLSLIMSSSTTQLEHEKKVEEANTASCHVLESKGAQLGAKDVPLPLSEHIPEEEKMQEHPINVLPESPTRDPHMRLVEARLLAGAKTPRSLRIESPSGEDSSSNRFRLSPSRTVPLSRDGVNEHGSLNSPSHIFSNNDVLPSPSGANSASSRSNMSARVALDPTLRLRPSHVQSPLFHDRIASIVYEGYFPDKLRISTNLSSSHEDSSDKSLTLEALEERIRRSAIVPENSASPSGPVEKSRRWEWALLPGDAAENADESCGKDKNVKGSAVSSRSGHKFPQKQSYDCSRIAPLVTPVTSTTINSAANPRFSGSEAETRSQKRVGKYLYRRSILKTANFPSLPTTTTRRTTTTAAERSATFIKFVKRALPGRALYHQSVLKMRHT